MRKLRMSGCAVLYLVLKKKWYDMIANGEKREEYRDLSDYWTKRIKNWLLTANDRGLAVVAFSRGYTKAGMFFVCRGCSPSWKHRFPQWGEPETPHFVIHLGERVELLKEVL